MAPDAWVVNASPLIVLARSDTWSCWSDFLTS